MQTYSELHAALLGMHLRVKALENNFNRGQWKLYCPTNMNAQLNIDLYKVLCVVEDKINNRRGIHDGSESDIIPCNLVVGDNIQLIIHMKDDYTVKDFKVYFQLKREPRYTCHLISSEPGELYFVARTGGWETRVFVYFEGSLGGVEYTVTDQIKSTHIPMRSV
jgi:hypothetical protein